MTTRVIARHRAEVTSTTSLAVIAKSVSSNAGTMGRQAAVIAAASGLVLTSAIAANAAEPTAPREAAPASTLAVQSSTSSVISAESTVAISFEKPSVTTSPAPVVAPEPEVVEAPAAVTAEVAPAVQAEPAGAVTPAAPVATAAPAAPAAPAVTVTPKSSAPAAPAASNGIGGAILSAAYAQIGINQDCTALVSNSLAAVGINFHDWPAGYLSLGRTVSAAEAQPGDIVYYADGGAGAAHVAIYAGNGQAVHGGFNGSTILFSVNVGSGPTFVRVNG